MPDIFTHNLRFLGLARLALAVSLAGVGGMVCLAATPAERGKPSPGLATLDPAQAIDLILVPEDQPWLVAVACPVASKLAQGGPGPLVLATRDPPSPQARTLLERLRPRATLVLAPAPGLEAAQGVPRLFPDLLPRDGRPWEASLRVAKQFWPASREVVVASLAEPEAVILAGALAAQRAEPLLVAEKGENEAAVLAGLRELGAERVSWVSVGPKPPPGWTTKLASRVEVLDRRAVRERTIAAIGAAAVRNVILARVPRNNGKLGQTAWLAPYLSLARRAPVVLCRSSDAAEAEAQVRGLIEQGRLRPQTLTILADYPSIGTRIVTIPPGQDPSDPQGDVATEPCTPKDFDRTAALGVGRIPLASLAEASAFFARGLLRERVAAAGPPRLVMIANPGLDGDSLPLCETISRITVEEFRNFRFHVDAFYRQPADRPEILAAAQTADAIVYEGHVEDQDLFKPRRRPGEPERIGVLEGLPVVILQSCDSLRKGVLREIHESGGVALVGTSTPVHSTSGAAFVKALADGVLYRGETLGEALRDAQNYFLCLEDLKDLRGHTQQAKSQRVAVSFRLWGDPELRVFPRGLGQPALPPVSARWNGEGRLSVRLPAQRLPKVENEEYVARLFPGSEAAGMVEHVPGEAARRLTPLCFFKLPLPDGFLKAGYDAIGSPGAKTPRAVFRVDPMERFLYVLYYPASERPGQTFTLELARQPRRAHP